MSASDAPLRDPGLRTRSGNAMARTRAALLAAARSCLEELGVRGTPMGAVASTAGVAKATLYNHFRTKDDVVRALVAARVAELAAAAEGLPAQEALALAARGLCEDAALRRVADGEPALLLPLLVPGDGREWREARGAVDRVVGPDRGELVLRWLLSQLLWPLTPVAAREQAGALVGASEVVPAQGGPSGLGWPAAPDRLSSR